MFDYLTAHDGPVVDGLEQFETVYAKDQPQYIPLRTLPGESGNSAISRFHFTDEQRKAIAEGADIYLEILHYRGPLAPSRLMVMSEPRPEATHFLEWWRAQTKGTYQIPKPEEKEMQSFIGTNGLAIEAMKKGLKVCRDGWIGGTPEEAARAVARSEGVTLDTAKKSIQEVDAYQPIPAPQVANPKPKEETMYRAGRKAGARKTS